KAQWVAEGDEHVVDDRRHGVRALQASHRVRDRLDERSRVTRDERRDELGVRTRGEAYAVGDELRAKLLDVHEVPVVAEGDRPRAAVMDVRLRIRPLVRAR